MGTTMGTRTFSRGAVAGTVAVIDSLVDTPGGGVTTTSAPSLPRPPMFWRTQSTVRVGSSLATTPGAMARSM